MCTWCINLEMIVQDALNLWKYFFNAAKIYYCHMLACLPTCTGKVISTGTNIFSSLIL